MCRKCNERMILNAMNKRRSSGLIPTLTEMDNLLRQREAFETEEEMPF